MYTMDQLLENIGINTAQSLLLSKVFLLVLSVLLFNFVVRKVFARLAIQLSKTENEYRYDEFNFITLLINKN